MTINSDSTSITTYYQDLLILQYREKTKARATIGTLVRALLMDLLPLDVQNAFNIDPNLGDTAVGAQLDMLAKYVGVSRTVTTPTYGLTVLDDTDLLSLIRIKIAENNLGSSLYEIQDFVVNYLDSILFVFDHADMTMSFYLNKNYMSLILAYSLVSQNLLPKPMGVSYAAVMYLESTENIFGFRTYNLANDAVFGFNNYVTFTTDTPFLSYADAIAI